MFEQFKKLTYLQLYRIVHLLFPTIGLKTKPTGIENLWTNWQTHAFLDL